MQRKALLCGNVNKETPVSKIEERGTVPVNYGYGDRAMKNMEND